MNYSVKELVKKLHNHFVYASKYSSVKFLCSHYECNISDAIKAWNIYDDNCNY